MGPRTATRPVASGRITPPRALEFGLALSAASFTVLASGANLLTAVLALVGNLFYVIVYTGYLKRRGPQNIVLGGAAGAVPPLVGYAAATGSVAVPALWLFVARVPLDAAALLGARAAAEGALREGGGADAARRRRRCGDAAADRRLHGHARRGERRAVRDRRLRRRSTSAAALVLGGIFLALAWSLSRAPSRRGAATRLPLLAALPRAALRRRRDRPPALGARGRAAPRSTASPPRATSRTSHIRASSWPGTRQASRNAPARDATNENVALCPGSRPYVGFGELAPANAGRTVIAPSTTAHEWRIPPRSTQVTGHATAAARVTRSSPRP